MDEARLSTTRFLNHAFFCLSKNHSPEAALEGMWQKALARKGDIYFTNFVWQIVKEPVESGIFAMVAKCEPKSPYFLFHRALSPNIFQYSA